MIKKKKKDGVTPTDTIKNPCKLTCQAKKSQIKNYAISDDNDLNRINTTSTRLIKPGTSFPVPIGIHSFITHSLDGLSRIFTSGLARYRDDGHSPQGGASDGSDGGTIELLV